MSGGGGFDPGKELANLDKSLSLSENAPLILRLLLIWGCLCLLLKWGQFLVRVEQSTKAALAKA